MGSAFLEIASIILLGAIAIFPVPVAPGQAVFAESTKTAPLTTSFILQYTWRGVVF